MSTELELVLALFFIVIIASSSHPMLRVILGTIVGVLMILVAIVLHSDDEVHR